MQKIETVEWFARVEISPEGGEATLGPYEDRGTANRYACQYGGYVERHVITRVIHVSERKGPCGL